MTLIYNPEPRAIGALEIVSEIRVFCENPTTKQFFVGRIITICIAIDF